MAIIARHGTAHGMPEPAAALPIDIGRREIAILVPLALAVIILGVDAEHRAQDDRKAGDVADAARRLQCRRSQTQTQSVRRSGSVKRGPRNHDEPAACRHAPGVDSRDRRVRAAVAGRIGEAIVAPGGAGDRAGGRCCASFCHQIVERRQQRSPTQPAHSASFSSPSTSRCLPPASGCCSSCSPGRRT